MIGTKIQYRQTGLLLLSYKLSENGFFLYAIFAAKDNSLSWIAKDVLGRRLTQKKCEFIHKNYCKIIDSLYLNEGVWWKDYYQKLQFEINNIRWKVLNLKA